MRSLIAAIVVATAFATADTPVRSSPAVMQIAQGDSSAVRDRAIALYSAGNSRLHQDDIFGARRNFEAAIAMEFRYFATLGSELREGEASFLVQCLTLAGVTEYKSSSHSVASEHWRIALDLYGTYLPILNRRFLAGDALLRSGHCTSAFASYSGTLGKLEPDILPTLRAAARGSWIEAQRHVADARDTTPGDLVRGMLALCPPQSRVKAEEAFVAALTDYEPTSSQTPNTGPLQASSIRLVLFAMKSSQAHVHVGFSDGWTSKIP